MGPLIWEIRMQFTTGILGAAFAGAILYLLRRDHIRISHALYWLLFAIGGLVFGLFPQLSDAIAAQLGVSYGPMLISVIALVALVLRCLIADIQATRVERDVRVLAQRLAVYEMQIEKNKRRHEGENE